MPPPRNFAILVYEPRHPPGLIRIFNLLKHTTHTLSLSYSLAVYRQQSVYLYINFILSRVTIDMTVAAGMEVDPIDISGDGGLLKVCATSCSPPFGGITHKTFCQYAVSWRGIKFLICPLIAAQIDGKNTRVVKKA